jgi:hypothetical protein
LEFWYYKSIRKSLAVRQKTDKEEKAKSQAAKKSSAQ